MNTTHKLAAVAFTLIFPSLALADSRWHGQRPGNGAFVGSHAGQVDTDGILSPGEIPNRNIDYSRSFRNAEWRGDYRVENPYNYAAAREDRSWQFWRDRDRDREERIREERREERDRERRHNFWGW